MEDDFLTKLEEDQQLLAILRRFLERVPPRRARDRVELIFTKAFPPEKVGLSLEEQELVADFYYLVSFLREAEMLLEDLSGESE